MRDFLYRSPKLKILTSVKSQRYIRIVRYLVFVVDIAVVGDETQFVLCVRSVQVTIQYDFHRYYQHRVVTALACVISPDLSSFLSFDVSGRCHTWFCVKDSGCKENEN